MTKPSRANQLAVLSLTVLGLITSSSSNGSAQNLSFICTVDQDGIPTTYAQANDTPIPVFKWQIKDFPPPWTPMRRCQEVTQRLNNFKSQGIPLNNFQSGPLNKQTVICVGPCIADSSNLLFTLSPGQNPEQVLQAIITSSEGSAGVVYQNSKKCPGTPGVVANGDGTVTFDLERHIERELCLNQSDEEFPDFQIVH
ncbi:COP23 domain-containing protein [Gloeocapsa sp. PCC 73106]|uniref:COP23 domain-containing protein n=1 Tax=Gloeocapsa sp. PCC 73106 TaxID=102232 RepID=UPI0002ACEEFD|nr:COP23 domain-containing protein [Gloeocapsa sp. PCC 73106]ELR97695.1 hypothetical protein GLO73106DRAFT_00015080 [Gloeocapsa sp. PCC 73106]